jgi:hypothetical protein
MHLYKYCFCFTLLKKKDNECAYNKKKVLIDDWKKFLNDGEFRILALWVFVQLPIIVVIIMGFFMQIIISTGFSCQSSLLWVFLCGFGDIFSSFLTNNQIACMERE